MIEGCHELDPHSLTHDSGQQVIKMSGNFKNILVSGPRSSRCSVVVYWTDRHMLNNDNIIGPAWWLTDCMNYINKQSSTYF